MFENAKHGVLRIPDLDPHHLLVLLNGLPEPCIEQLQLRLELIQINTIAMLGFDRGSQRNDFVSMLVQQNWVQVGSADTDIRSCDSQARCDIDFSTQAICRQFLIVGIQQVVGLSIQAPDCRDHRMIVVCRKEAVPRELVIQEVLHALEHGQHLQHSVVRGISTMYRRYFVIRHLDQTISSGDIQAVVENLRQYRLRYLPKCVSRNPGTLKDGLQGAGSHGVIRAIHAQQQAGILHGINQDLRTAVGLIELHVQAPKLGVLLKGLKLEAVRGRFHP